MSHSPGEATMTATELDSIFGDLPTELTTSAETDRWVQRGADMRAGSHLDALSLDPRAGLDKESGVLLDVRPALAWWSLLAAEFRKGEFPSGELRPKVADKFLFRCHEVRGSVLRAGELVFRRLAFLGATTEECLFLCAAFAWPLRHVAPAAGALAWEYLGSAPWGVEIEALLRVVRYLEKSKNFGDDELKDWADRLETSGRGRAGRSLLEAVAVFHSEGDGPIARQTESSRFSFPPMAERGVVHVLLTRLAEKYISADEEGLHARAFLQRFREASPGHEPTVEVLESRLWDAPFSELYKDAYADPRRSATRAERAWQEGRPYLALRTLEANIGSVLSPPAFLSSLKKGDHALKLLSDQIPEADSGSFAPTAVEPACLLVLRSMAVNRSTKRLRTVVKRALASNYFTGTNGRLAAERSQIEAWLNDTNPINFKLNERRRWADHVGDDPARLALIQPWLGLIDEAEPGDDDPVVVMGPREDQIGAWGSKLVRILDVTSSAIEAALGAAVGDLKIVLGDLDPLLEQAFHGRSSEGWHLDLRKKAKAACQGAPLIAGLTTAGVSLLPASPLVGAVDIGSTMLMTFRSCARVGAVYGVDARTSEGLGFVLEAMALGAGVDPFSLAGPFGGSTFGANTARLAGAASSWVLRKRSAEKGAELLVKKTASLLGRSLSKRELVKVIPVAGALLAAATTYEFVDSAVESMHTIGSRELALDSGAR